MITDYSIYAWWWRTNWAYFAELGIEPFYWGT